MDEWGDYPLERRRLLEALRADTQEQLLILSGNVHFSEISEFQEGAFELVEFTSSGLTHINESYPKAPNRCCPLEIVGVNGNTQNWLKWRLEKDKVVQIYDGLE